MTNMDLSQVPLQDYKEATIEEAVALGYDVVQPKYDGWNARIEIAYGWVTFYSKTGRVYRQFCFPNAELLCVLKGEDMYGTQWSQRPEREGKTYIFDLVSLNGNLINHLQYRERIALLHTVIGRLPATFELVQSRPISWAPDMWKQLVEGPEQFEGVVFRKRLDNAEGTLLRLKKTFTEDLIAIEFIQATDGKHAGYLKSIVGRSKDGGETTVGGGYADDQRVDFWLRREALVGRIFEAEARVKFESGALRSANFTRWRDDKDTL